MVVIIDLNKPKVFRISQLVGRGDNPNASKDKKGRNKRCKSEAVVETSSFKVSNKLSQKSKKKQNTQRDNNIDLLWLHDEAQKHHAYLQDVILPKKQHMLASLLTHEHGYERKKKKIMQEIHDLVERKEEKLYNARTKDIVAEYKDMLLKTDQSCMRRDDSGGITQYITKYDNVSRQQLAEKYCRALNNGHLVNTSRLKFDNSVCSECGSETMYNEGFVSCTECGLSSENSINELRLSYHDYRDIIVKSPFSYKRINRFQELLSTLQAKDNVEIPATVMQLILKEIQKEKDVDMDMLDHKRVRQVLKRLALTQFYEHVPHILNKLSNIPPIQIPTEIENMLREMFFLIQTPYENARLKICPSRSNFLSYNFVLYKFCELLDLDEYKNCFTLLKSGVKLRFQDKLWCEICSELGWEYIATI